MTNPDVEHVIREIFRSENSLSLTSLIDSLAPEGARRLLSRFRQSPGVQVLVALWSSHHFPPYVLLPHVALGATNLSSSVADSLLTEAESLLAKTARGNIPPPGALGRTHAEHRTPDSNAILQKRGLCETPARLCGLRALTTAATALLAHPLTLHTPRLVLACSRCASLYSSRGRKSAAAMGAALCSRLTRILQSTASDASEQGEVVAPDVVAALLLALLDTNSAAGVNEGALLRCVEAHVRHAACVSSRAEDEISEGRNRGHAVPAVLRAVLQKVRSALPRAEWVVYNVRGDKKGPLPRSSEIRWTSAALYVLREAPADGFPDLLSVLEWQVSELPSLAEVICSQYLSLVEYRLGSSIDDGENEGCSSAEKALTERDVAVLAALLRSVDGDAERQKVLHVFSAMVENPTLVLNEAFVASSASESRQPKGNVALDSALIHGLVIQPGMDVRCPVVVEIATWLIQAPDRPDVRKWGARLLEELFIRHEVARNAVLGMMFSALAEEACDAWVRSVLCDVLAHLASRQVAPALFRSHLSLLKHWLGFLGSMPASSALQVVIAVSPLAALLPAFCDSLAVMLRKLLAMRSTHAQTIAGTGLISLIVQPGLDAAVCEEMVELTRSLIESASLRARALLLSHLSMRVIEFDTLRLQDERFGLLHDTILSRFDVIRNSHGCSKFSLLSERPIQLNACFDIVCGAPSLREAVPEMLEYAIVLRHAVPAADHLYQLFRNYVLDTKRVLRDLSEPHATASSPRWVYAKARLLCCICELLIDASLDLSLGIQKKPESQNVTEIPEKKMRGLLSAYAAALIVRDAITPKVKSDLSDVNSFRNASASACLDRLFCGYSAAGSGGRLDQVCAREASSLAFAAGSAGGPPVGLAVAKDYDDIVRRGKKARVANVHMSLKSALASLAFATTLLSEAQRRTSSRRCIDDAGQIAVSIVCTELAKALLGEFSVTETEALPEGKSAEHSKYVGFLVDLLRCSHPWQSTDSTGGNGSHNSDVPSTGIRAGTGLSGQARQDDELLGSFRSMWSDFSEFLVDEEIRSIVMRFLSGPDNSLQRTHAFMRNCAIQMLTLVSDMEPLHDVWSAFVKSVADGSGVNGENLAACVDCDGNNISGHENVARALVLCFEREFEYGMSTSQCIAYVKLVSRVMHSEAARLIVRERRMAFFGFVKGTVTRLLLTYKMTHARVLRPLFGLLLEAIEPELAIEFLQLVFAWLGRESALDSDSEGNVGGRRWHRREHRSHRLGLTEFDEDIVAEALDLDGAAPVPDAYIKRNKRLVAGKVSVYSPQKQATVNASADDAEEDQGRVRDAAGQDVLLCQVHEMSLMDSEDCRCASLCAGLAYVESRVHRVRLRGQSVEAAAGRSWRPQDATTILQGCCVLEYLVYGNRANNAAEYMRQGGRRRRHEVPSSAIGRANSVVQALLEVACVALKDLRECAVVETWEHPESSIKPAVNVVTCMVSAYNTWRAIGTEPWNFLVADSRNRFAFERFVLNSASVADVRTDKRNLQQHLHAIRTMLVADPTSRKSARPEDRFDSVLESEEQRVDTSHSPLRMHLSRKRRRIRSRNPVVDRFLGDERGEDRYADLEDFLVASDCGEL